MIDRESILTLLDIPKENIQLFSVRHSNRAKRLIFKSSLRKGFEIVLPRIYDDNWVLETVAKRKPKIEKRITEIQDDRKVLKPTSIVLPSTGNTLKVNYREFSDESSEAIIQTSTKLEITEKPEDVFWVPFLLQKWLQNKALEYLPKRLDDVSTKLKLPYNKVRIKRQKTIWGSCSIKRNINLNRNLMLMPPEVVDYVLHHEIVHLKVLSHSSKFWKALEKSFPNYRESLTQLKHFETFTIPGWALI